MISTALILHGLTLSSNADAIQSINFYLPINSKQFPELTEKLQQALINQNLSEINVVSADYWQLYQQNIRRGRVGIYYAAPHFTAWTIEYHQFHPLVRTPEKLKYVIASQQSNPGIFEIRDLERKTICTLSALNLDYLLVTQTFEKNLQPAHIQIVESLDTQMNNPHTPCSAFSLSEYQFTQQQLNKPIKHIMLAQGQEYSNYGVSIHPSLRDDYTEKITAFLQKQSTLDILKPMIELHSRKTILIPATREDYPPNYTAALKQYWKE